MAVPKRRVSKTKKNMRRGHDKIKSPGMIKCTNCGAMIKAHRVCPQCGNYKNKNVIEKEEVK